MLEKGLVREQTDDDRKGLVRGKTGWKMELVRGQTGDSRKGTGKVAHRG